MVKFALLMADQKTVSMQTKEDILKNHDPNGVGTKGSFLGLPFTPDNAELVIIPVPWDVTVSYSEGTAKGPAAVLEASTQLDLYVKDIPDAWKLGISLLPISEEIENQSITYRKESASYIKWLEDGEKDDVAEAIKTTPSRTNISSRKLNEWVASEATKWLDKGKMVALLGGDHSTPRGLIDTLANKHGNIGILQIDAHMDLREAYEGFENSHASIMYNALQNKNVSKLVQVGIRDFCQDEAEMAENSNGRIAVYYDQDIKESLMEGSTWKSICDKIIADLPERVYVSFDIDGLDPKLCPHTGTPVAGGLEFQEAMYLIKRVVQAGKTIVGFDLCEVTPGEDEWDANVGARVLYRLANLMAVSQGKLRLV